MINIKFKKYIVGINIVLIALAASFFIFGIVILGNIIMGVSGFLTTKEETKVIETDLIIPIELMELYKEVDKEFGAPWNIIASIHAVQSKFAMDKGGIIGGFFAKYTDAFNLSNRFWEQHQESKERYWALKRAEENYDKRRESCSRYEDASDRDSCFKGATAAYKADVEAAMKIIPDRDKIEDIIYTVAIWLKDIDLENPIQMHEKIYAITLDHEQTEMAKYYNWLYNMLYGRPGWPIPEEFASDYITSRFGSRVDPFDPEKEDYHYGLDIAPPEGAPVFAFAEGKVIYAGEGDGYGTLIVVEHEDYERKDGHVETIRTAYGHSKNLLVRTGMKVAAGQKIAEIGNEGNSTGAHLHFEVRIKPSIFSDWERIDPLPWLITPEEYEGMTDS